MSSMELGNRSLLTPNLKKGATVDTEVSTETRPAEHQESGEGQLRVIKTGVASFHLTDAPEDLPVPADMFPVLGEDYAQQATATLPVPELPSAEPLPLEPASSSSESRGKPMSQAVVSLKKAFTEIRGPFSKQSLTQRRFQQAKELEKSGQYLQAIDAYRKILSDDHENWQALHRLAICADLANLPQQAGLAFEEAVVLNSADTDLLCDCGFHYQMIGNTMAARQYYEQVLLLAPEHSRAHNHLGVLLAELGDAQGAESHFTAAGLGPQQIADNLHWAVRK